jgi:uncharacterized membrane protein
MDLYTFFKLLHVISAIAWVGGGLTLLASAIFNVRDHGPAESIRTAQTIGSLAMRWFLPASGLTLVSGVIAAFLGSLWGEAWVILGLMGFAATFLTGHFILRVKAIRMGELMKEGREEEAVAEGLALLRVSKFDYAVILVVVADMVLKPVWTDFVTLGLFAVVVVGAAAYVVLIEPYRPRPAPAG